MNAHSTMKGSPPASSKRKTRILRPIRTKVTTGVMRRWRIVVADREHAGLGLCWELGGRDHSQAKREVYPRSCQAKVPREASRQRSAQNDARRGFEGGRGRAGEANLWRLRGNSDMGEKALVAGKCASPRVLLAALALAGFGVAGYALAEVRLAGEVVVSVAPEVTEPAGPPNEAAPAASPAGRGRRRSGPGLVRPRMSRRQARPWRRRTKTARTRPTAAKRRALAGRCAGR